MIKKSQSKDVEKLEEKASATVETIDEVVPERTQVKSESTRATSSTMFFLPPEQTKFNDQKIKNLERRIERLERKINSNERFARTLAKSVTTQSLAANSILYVLRKALHEDAEIRDEFTATIKAYDRHKFRRWFSGFLSVLLWIVSVGLAACIGAFIYWTFSGQ